MAERRRWEAVGNVRLDRGLADAFPDLSRVRIQALIADGHVRVDGEPAKASSKPAAGQIVELDEPDVVSSELVGEDIPLDILHEDDDLIVIVKPAGMAVHPSAGHATGTLVHALLGRPGTLSSIGGEERPGIVHRLDAGTSGVMVVAKNDVTHRALSERFARHDMDRRYLAVVHRAPLHDNGTIRSELGRDPRDRLRIASVEGGRPAVTHWTVLSRGDRVALVECRLETGRTHQIRVHLAEAGHPVVGDTTYARRDCIAPAGIRPLVEALTHPLLHAYHLAFPHPRDGRPLAFSVPPPPDFVQVCEAAGLKIP